MSAAHELVADFRAWYNWWCDLEGDCPIAPSDVRWKAWQLLNGIMGSGTGAERAVAHSVIAFFSWLRPSDYSVTGGEARKHRDRLLSSSLLENL